jgi:hypothetical protein
MKSFPATQKEYNKMQKFRTVPMPSPAGTNHAGLFLKVPVQSGHSGYAYDSREGLGEEDEYEDADTESDDLPEGFVARLCKHLAEKNLTQDDIAALKGLVESKENPSALDYEPSARPQYANDRRPARRSHSDARLLEKWCPDAARINAVY